MDSWLERLHEIGPIYPFAGAEATLLLACLALWIGWMTWQFRSEKREHQRTAGFLRECGEVPEPDEDEALRRVLERRLDRAEAEKRLECE